MGRRKTDFKPYKPDLTIRHPQKSSLVASAKTYEAPPTEPPRFIPSKEEAFFIEGVTHNKQIPISTLAPPPTPPTDEQEWARLIRAEASAGGGHESDPNDQPDTNTALVIYATRYKRPLKGEIWFGEYLDNDGNIQQPQRKK